MLEMLENLENNGGLTLKNWKTISYKTGYQVSDYGVKCTTIKEAKEEILKMKGNCGIWFSNNIYYIDHSFRVKTKKTRLKLAKNIIKFQF